MRTILAAGSPEAMLLSEILQVARDGVVIPDRRAERWPDHRDDATPPRPVEATTRQLRRQKARLHAKGRKLR